MQAESNESMQLDEIQVLHSMYSTEELRARKGMDRCWLMTIPMTRSCLGEDQERRNDDQDDILDPLIFEFWFHTNYPSSAPPYFEIKGGKNWIYLLFHRFKREDYESTNLISNSPHEMINKNDDETLIIKEFIQQELKNMFMSGMPIAFTWIEFLKNELMSTVLDYDKIEEHVKSTTAVTQQTRELTSGHSQQKGNKILSNNNSTETQIPIIHGEPFTEKKSKFIGHVATVHSLQQVTAMLEQLKEDDKIANATHNIYAYRIRQGDQILENRDDDGETGAADQILYLMQISNAENVCCVVTRWYGGIKLGNDRLRIITGVAKKVLQDNGYIASRK
ncbi:hypothetical protein FDP41_008732 [Naegleria fowleri]|uniref:RWD domain-containing protein n=1 Tax=Naegleria fowleri TaxID=5763 RepID=A0A6A5BGG1_NAEFO|nr:uncharacterized protein FDP41_008732 [Naegleria fowleri]KAF0973068.1 hypothetical protein FDP41_008732 [Naegleria fowleri]CAG4713174.1 unnamed protein product [Naegleria fowleri]